MPNTLSEQLPCLAVYYIPCQPCPTHSQNSCLAWQFTTFLANHAQHTLRTVALLGSLPHSLPTMPKTLSEQLPCLAVYYIPCQPCPTHSQNSCLAWKITFLANHAQHTLRTVALLGRSHSLPTMPNTLSEQLPCLAVYYIPCQPCPTHSQNSCLAWQFITITWPILDTLTLWLRSSYTHFWHSFVYEPEGSSNTVTVSVSSLSKDSIHSIDARCSLLSLPSCDASSRRVSRDSFSFSSFTTLVL